MKSVSTAYKKSMKNALRNRSHVKVVFQNIDPSATSDGEWEDNGHTSYSELDTLNYEHQYGTGLATLELNRWSLDGSLNVYSTDSVKDGFVSSFLSSSSGGFTTVPALTREFEAVHSLAGLTLSFDTRCDEFPVGFTVKFYLSGTLVDTVNVTEMTSSTYVLEHGVDQYDKIVISPTAILPYRRFRMECILFGFIREYGNTELVKTYQSHDVDPLSRRLPSESFAFTIIDFEHKYDPDNPQGIYAYVEEKSPVSITFGYELDDNTIEWLAPDRYLLNSKPTVQNARVTFLAGGLIESLSDTYYKSQLGSKNLYDMAVAVLTDANLGLTPSGANPWSVDESLKTMYTTAVLPIDTHMNCLQLIAHAGRCRLFTDDDNIIHIEPFNPDIANTYTGTTTDNGHTSFSEWDTVDVGTDTDKSYVTLEMNRWVLGDDNAQEILPNSNFDKLGYISSAISGSDGTFTENPVFTRVFDNYCNANALRIRFDTAAEEWVRSLKVQYYHDSTLVDTQTVTDISEQDVFITSTLASSVNKIVITVLSTSPYRRVRVNQMLYRSSDFSLDFTTITENSQITSKVEKLKSVSVALYSYTVSDTTSVLYEEETSETALHVELVSPAQNIAITVTGGSVLTQNVYGRAIDLTLTTGTKTVSISGKYLNESKQVINTSVSATGEVDTEENPLITNETMCTALTQHVIKYLTLRNTYDVEYRGNPELEVGDTIGMQTRYTNDMPILILTDEITFAGGLSGSIKAKGLT